MKKNITINLCGRLFNIDEDAYELLNNYTTTLRNYFRRQEGGEEIANDIEERIAELMEELKANGTLAITIEHVQDIIQRIGEVKDIASDFQNETAGNVENIENVEDFEGKNAETTAPSIGEKISNWFEGLKKKRFYRDSQDKMLGGVLSGCAKYFGGNVLVWRLVYVLLSLGTIQALFASSAIFTGFSFFNLLMGPLLLITALFTLIFKSTTIILYAIVYFLAPEAKSPEDRLRMKGKEVNPQTLSSEVAESARAGEYDKGEEKSRANGCLNGLFSVIVVCIKIFIWFIGALLFIPSIIILVVLVAASFIATEVIDGMFGVYGNEVYLQMPSLFWILGGCAFAACFIPAYASGHCFLNLFNRVKPMSGRQILVWVVLWLLSVIGIICTLTKITSETNSRVHEIVTARRAELQADRKEHMHDRVYYSDVDWANIDTSKILSHGWSVVRIDSIVVKSRQPVHYGVSTDQKFTGKKCTAQWFSATDFKLLKIKDYSGR